MFDVDGHLKLAYLLVIKRGNGKFRFYEGVKQIKKPYHFHVETEYLTGMFDYQRVYQCHWKVGYPSLFLGVT